MSSLFFHRSDFSDPGPSRPLDRDWHKIGASWQI